MGLRMYTGNESRHYTAHWGLLLVKVTINCMLGTVATRYLLPGHRRRAWPAVRRASTLHLGGGGKRGKGGMGELRKRKE